MTPATKQAIIDACIEAARSLSPDLRKLSWLWRNGVKRKEQ